MKFAIPEIADRYEARGGDIWISAFTDDEAWKVEVGYKDTYGEWASASFYPLARRHVEELLPKLRMLLEQLPENTSGYELNSLLNEINEGEYFDEDGIWVPVLEGMLSVWPMLGRDNLR